MSQESKMRSLKPYFTTVLINAYLFLEELCVPMCGLQKMPDFHKTYLKWTKQQVASLAVINFRQICNAITKVQAIPNKQPFKPRIFCYSVWSSSPKENFCLWPAFYNHVPCKHWVRATGRKAALGRGSWCRTWRTKDPQEQDSAGWGELGEWVEINGCFVLIFIPQFTCRQQEFLVGWWLLEALLLQAVWGSWSHEEAFESNIAV